ncbi:hypothetical protein NCS52_01299500 [Fusarium sp. LHS14.1]|nr:hypothetical protein NCS52_01299500 [Fusarium sp. LHS14.1]
MSKLSFVYMHQRRWNEAEMLQSYLLEVKCVVLGDGKLSIAMSRESHRFIATKRWQVHETTNRLLGRDPVTGKEKTPSPILAARLPWTGFPWAALKQDILANRKNKPPSNLPQLVDNISIRIPVAGSPPVPKGQARICWTCSCGQRLFDDFSSSTPEPLQALQQIYRIRACHPARLNTAVALPAKIQPAVPTWHGHGQHLFLGISSRSS